MPDLEDPGAQLLDESFGKGEPHKDVNFNTLKDRTSPKVERQVAEKLPKRE